MGTGKQLPHYPWYPYDAAASLRLQVTPREAEVFVDGSYAGTVDGRSASRQAPLRRRACEIIRIHCQEIHSLHRCDATLPVRSCRLVSPAAGVGQG
jgi:hypothetical protein